MATQSDVRRIALALPETSEEQGRFAFAVLNPTSTNKGKRKAIAWVWQERVDPKKARVPNPSVIAIRVANDAVKEMLLSSDKKKIFTEPHYAGFPAVLVRLAAIRVGELEELITNAWRCQAPKPLVQAFDQGHG